MARQVFRTDQHPFEVTTLTVDQVVWFKGCEAAACLGYARPRNAVKDHVDGEDKKTYEALVEGRIDTVPPCNQQSHEVYVNESGLYVNESGLYQKKRWRVKRQIAKTREADEARAPRTGRRGQAAERRWKE